MWASARRRCPFWCVYMSKIERPNIKLLTSDFSDLRHKTVYDFVGLDGVRAYNAMRLPSPFAPYSEIGGYTGDPRAIEEYKRLVVDEPSVNSRQLLDLASFLQNDEFINAVLSQFAGVVPLAE